METTTAVPVWRTSAGARLVWGGALTVLPHRLLGTLGRPTRLAVATLRVLGVRHVVQAAVTLRRPTPVVLTVGAAADGLHALTAAALAVLDRRQRPIALLDTGIASGWMLLGLRAARRSRRWPGRTHRPRRLRGWPASRRGGRR